jgi:choline dehydrogenase-like flavoprotein
MRHLPNDFRIRTLYGVGQDWPITYEQLEPWYLQAEQEIGVAGDTDLGSPRSGPYPLPPIPASYLDQQINDALQPQGLQTLISPHARNSITFQNRPACGGNNTCVPICTLGAKYDAAVHATMAQEAGAQILDEAVAFKLDVSAEGMVERVHFKRPDNSEHTATCRIYVIAAHAIETPKLLLMSRAGALPNGVANPSDQVGRNLMDHPTLVSLCLSWQPVYPYRGPTEISGIEHMRDGDFRRERAAFRVPIGNDGWSFGGRIPPQLAGDYIDDDIRGEELRTRLHDSPSARCAWPL